MSKLGGKKIVIIGVVALFLGAAAGFLALQLLVPAGTASAFGVGLRSVPDTAPASPTPIEPGIMYSLDERVINLLDTSGLRYLKIGLVLEFDLPDARGLKGDDYKKRQDQFAKDLASRRPIMEDAVTTTLASKSWISISNPDGKEKLREELKTRLGDLTGAFKLVNVYYTQFIIQ